MCIICQTLVNSKKVSALGEDRCDKLLQAASDQWEGCDLKTTCEKRFYKRFGKHRESEDVSPHRLCLQKIALNLGLALKI